MWYPIWDAGLRLDHSVRSLADAAACVAAGVGVTLLPAGCRLATHRVLGAAEGLPPIDSFELALYYRDGAPAATLALAQRLAAFCGLK